MSSVSTPLTLFHVIPVAYDAFHKVEIDQTHMGVWISSLECPKEIAEFSLWLDSTLIGTSTGGVLSLSSDNPAITEQGVQIIIETQVGESAERRKEMGVTQPGLNTTWIAPDRKFFIEFHTRDKNATGGFILNLLAKSSNIWIRRTD